MQTVGIRELKAHLSRVLRDVVAGEVVLVTDRGRVIAELRRPEAVERTGSAVERTLARLAATGRLRVAEGPAEYVRSPLKSKKGTARALLDADRGE